MVEVNQGLKTGSDPLVTFPHAFANRQEDHGLWPGFRAEQPYLMLARYYTSGLGRFMSVDPVTPIDRQFEDEVEFEALLTNPQVWNRYSYALNNPIYYRDPNGRFPAAALAPAAPLFLTPGVGQAAALGLAVLVVGYAAYEGIDLYIHYNRNNHLYDLAMGDLLAAETSLNEHGPQLDPDDSKWKQVIDRIKKQIQEGLETAKKMRNKAKIEEVTKKAKELSDRLTNYLNRGVKTEPKGPLQQIQLPEPEPKVIVKCSDNLC